MRSHKEKNELEKLENGQHNVNQSDRNWEDIILVEEKDPHEQMPNAPNGKRYESVFIAH